MTQELDRYGGFAALKGTATGWFHLEELNGRTWFVTPEGNAFFPVSLAHPYTGHNRDTVRDLYSGDQDAWMEDWFARQRDLGFNCAIAGPTSDCRDITRYVDRARAIDLYRRESFPYAVGLFLVPHRIELAEGEQKPDIFSPEYREWAAEMIAGACAEHADDPLVMGYYYGFGSWMKPREWMASLGRHVTDENEQEHIREMAVSLYSFAYEQIRRHDANHLILGPYVKEQSFDMETWKALVPYIDTLTPQHVNRDISFAEQSEATGLPVLVSDENSGYMHDEAHRHAHSMRTTEGKGRVYESLMERHLRDASVCGVNFCATFYDMNDGPLLDWWGMTEGLFDADGNPKSGLVDAVARANQGILERATAPFGPEELARLDAAHFSLWDREHAG